MKTKNDVRQHIQAQFNEKRSKISEINEGTMCDIVLDFHEVKRAKSIFIYQSFGSEMPTHRLINNLQEFNKTICVPKLIHGEIRSVLLSKNQEINGFGILEPISSEEKDCEVCIVPALAFDLNLNRLGRGKGYYDRYFAKNPSIFKIGFCYDFQLLDSIPVAAHDVKMDMIVTDKRIIK